MKKPPLYEMWNDGSREFAERIRRMIRLGYKISIIPFQKDYQASQVIGARRHDEK